MGFSVFGYYSFIIKQFSSNQIVDHFGKIQTWNLLLD